jgi:hypothetical protein
VLNHLSRYAAESIGKIVVDPNQNGLCVPTGPPAAPVYTFSWRIAMDFLGQRRVDYALEL